jgi:TetR/AcrR family fatty acid metabolism transcriptional regulator
MNRHSARGTAAGEGEGKRARILDAAARVFADKGFYNAKVSEIARVAGVADGTIYLYFRSKDDLLISIFEDRMEQVIDNARAAVAGTRQSPPLERLGRVVAAHIAMVESHPLLAEVLTVELRQSTRFLKEYKHTRFGELLKIMAGPIEDGQRDGSVRTDVEAQLIARALFGAIDELVLAWLLRPRAGARSVRARGNFELGPAAAQIADVFIEGLRPPQHGRTDSQRHGSQTHSQTHSRTHRRTR